MRTLVVEHLSAADSTYLTAILAGYKNEANPLIMSDGQFAIILEKRVNDEFSLLIYFDGTEAEFKRGCDMISIEEIGINTFTLYLSSESGVSIELLANEIISKERS